MRILICTFKIPYPLTGGGNLRIFNIGKGLSSENDIFLFYFRTPSDNQNDLEALRRSNIFKDCIHTEWPHSFAQRAVNYILLRSNLFYRSGLPRFKRVVKSKVEEIVAQNRIDVVHLHGPLLGMLLAEFVSVPKVLDLGDSLSLQAKRDVQLSSHWRDFFINYCRSVRLTREEKYLLQNFAPTTVVSPVDKRHLSKLNQSADIRVIPNGVETDYFSPREDIEEDHPSILFAGVMSYPPNIDAALYIYREILPLIRSQIPDLKFYIIGRDPASKIKNLAKDNHIIVTGFVEDIRQYILKASVVLCPMRRGSGIKNKILQAMATGKAVVTNPMGAEALEQDAEECLVIAETATEIAQKTIELLGDKALRQNLGRKASELMARKYTWEDCSRNYENIYMELLQRQASNR